MIPIENVSFFEQRRAHSVIKLIFWIALHFKSNKTANNAIGMIWTIMGT
jgi:hypothetical protein